VERIIVRRDMWKLAEQAKILTLPGSVLEDRQYQVDLTAIAVSSGERIAFRLHKRTCN
jgi:hypothetical protein